MPLPHSPAQILARRPHSLSRRRKTLSVQEGSCAANVVPPVKRLSVIEGGTLFAAFPVELRVEIFRYVCGDHCPVAKTTQGPLLLLRVCRAWKELVLQTPQLWTSFSIDLQRPLRDPGESDFLVRATKRWTDRSRNLPLSFALRYPTLDGTCINLVESLLPVSARWHDVTLYAPGTSLLPLCDAPPDTFPCLRALTLETVGTSPFLIQDLPINWAQLAKLDLFFVTVPTLDECLRILTQGVNLVQCRMNARCVLGDIDPAPARVVLPKLEDLQLKLYGGDHVSLIQGAHGASFLTFLGTLSVPSLEALSISWNVNHGPNQVAHWSDAQCRAFCAFLEASGGQLKAFTMACIPLDTHQALRCLRAVPALQHLRICLSQADGARDFIDNEFLHALTLRQPERQELQVVPLLRSIHLESHGAGFSNPVLLQFIESRWRYRPKPQSGSPPGHLERIELVSPTRQAEYLSRRFRDLKEGKLDVSAAVSSELSLLKVLGIFLNKDSYETTCFMNCDFPPHIRSLLVFRRK